MSRYWNPLPSAAWISPGRSGRDELQQHVAGLDASSPSRRNSGLKPISSGSPWNGHGHRLARLADVRRARRHRQLALGERQPQRRVLLRQQRDAAHDVGQLSPPPVRSSCSYASGSSWR